MLIGTIYMFGGTTAPEGFLLCDGSPVSRATYSDLFDVIGTDYGAGDGTTTFNLPDLSGRVVIGVSSGYSRSSTGGEETHTLTASEIPTHDHTIPSHGHTNTIKATTPKLTHSITQPAFTYSKANGKNASGGGTGGTFSTTTSSVNATRSANLAVSNHTAAACTKSGSVTDCAAFNSNSTGTGAAHENMQPYVTLNFIIYVGGN